MVLSKDLICKSRDGRSKMIMIDDEWLIRDDMFDDNDDDIIDDDDMIDDD